VADYQRVALCGGTAGVQDPRVVETWILPARSEPVS
jgi:hypothetical protein